MMTDRIARTQGIADPLPIVRQSVRDLLISSPAYHQLSRDKQKEMASLMVRVCHAATSLLAEELESDREARQMQETDAEPIAMAQAAGDFNPQAVNRVADETRNIINAVSFPRFVTELINGVFKAMMDSNVQQMDAFVDLLNNVSASLDGFQDTNVGPENTRQWLVDAFPGSYEITGGSTSSEPPDPIFGSNNDNSNQRIQLISGAQPPSEAALRTALGLSENESIPNGDPERVLVPLARRRLAAQRQQMLATMVQMGMQRIVIDSGRIHAAMRFHIDASSTTTSDRGSRFDFQNVTKGSGNFSAGPWGVQASMTNTIGYASTEQTQTTEDINAQVDVNSSVEIIFHTDYVPLNRITTQAQADRIRKNSINPAAEAKVAADERNAARKTSADAAQQRRKAIKNQLQPAKPPELPKDDTSKKPAIAKKIDNAQKPVLLQKIDR